MSFELLLLFPLTIFFRGLIALDEIEKQLSKDAADSPDVDAEGVIWIAQDQLRRPVKPRANARSQLRVLCIFILAGR